MLDIFLPILNFLKDAIIGLGDITFHNAALGIIIFTVAARLLILPLTLKSVRSSRAMQSLQPAIKEINEKYKVKAGQKLSAEKQQEKQAETMKLYSEYGVNPAAGCLPVLIQMPIFLAINAAMQAAKTDTHFITGGLLWFPNLTKQDPIYVLPVLMVLFQFMTQRMAMPKGGVADETQRRLQGIMQYMPIIFGVTAATFPAGPVLYWVTSGLFSVAQQYFITGWGSLSDIPGLGFLPTKTIPTVTLQKRDPSLPAKKTWMERMTERQAEIESQRRVTDADATGGTTVEGPSAGIRRAAVSTGVSADGGSADGSSDSLSDAYRQLSTRPTRPPKKSTAGRKRKQ